eukprot:m.54199 g.54199  ORF g.54199 m.54199 type:complete len:961 (+) comp10911_c0_seq1:172-3054(+)
MRVSILSVVLLVCAVTISEAFFGGRQNRGKPDTEYYDLLKIKRDATDREIRKAFKKIALAEHPDKHPGDEEAHQKFMLLNEAYEVLKDPELRKKYDRLGKKALEEERKGGRGQYEDWNFYQQDFGLYDEDDQIETFNSESFWEMYHGDETWMVNFYSPRCSHCHDLAPTWREFGLSVDGAIGVGAVNCQDSWDVCQQLGIRSYPSLLKFTKGDNRMLYHGRRDVESLTEFALQDIPRVTNLNHVLFENLLSQKSEKNSVVIICTSYDCESEFEYRKISASLEGLMQVYSMHCKQYEGFCEKRDFKHSQAVFISWDDNKKEMTMASFFPSRDGSGEIPDWDDVYSVKALADAAISMLPPPKKMTKEEVEASIDFDDSFHPLKDAFFGDVSKVKWSLISDFAACEQNNEGVHAFSMEHAVNVQACKEICQRYSICNAIDYYTQTGSCRLYEKSCSEPLSVMHGATSYTLTRGSGYTGLLLFFTDLTRNDPEISQLDRQARLIPAIRSVSKRVIHCNELYLVCERLSVNKLPSVVLFKKSGYETFHGDLKPSQIVQWTELGLKTRVITLTDRHFPDILDTSDAWFIDFFAGWCPPCKRMIPHFREASLLVAQSIKFGSVDCAVYGDLCNRMGIQSYPTPIFYNYSDNKPHFFNGDFNNANEFRTHIEDVLDPSLVKLDPQSWESTLKPSSSLFAVLFTAGHWCGPCTHMFQMLKEVARDLKGIVKFGYIDCDEEGDFCGRNGINAYPQLRRYPAEAGDRKLRKYSIFGGQRWAESISSWLVDWLPAKVSNMNRNKFLEKVIHKMSSSWFVSFSCPRWCGPCRHFQPKMKLIAHLLGEENIKFAHMDCDDNRDFCNEQGIEAYPTARLYVLGDGGAFEHLEHSHEAREIADIIRAKLPVPQLDTSVVAILSKFYTAQGVPKTEDELKPIALKYFKREHILYDKLEEKYGARPDSLGTAGSHDEF